MSDRTMTRVLRAAMWYAIAISLAAVVGLVGAVAQGTDEWWFYLTRTINYLGFAALFRVVASLNSKLIESERSNKVEGKR